MSLRRKLNLVGLYATSLLHSRRNAAFFRGIQTYCMFVGYPRTGHSLIGSLLDAHPSIVIAHELDALELFQLGFSQRQVFHLLLENSRKMAAAGRSHHGYSYDVPNQWQGRFEQLQVLGDKKGAERLYLEDCASILFKFKSPKKSRFDIDWSRGSIAKVRERMQAFTFLSGYAYDEENAASKNAPPQGMRSVLGRNAIWGMLITGKLLLPEAYTMMDGILTSFPV